MKRIGAAIIGSGNIGTDLMYKILRSPVLKPTLMVGIDPKSEGLARAKEMGLATTAEGIDGFVRQADLAEVVFDATSAKAHQQHGPILEKLGKIAVDLTPAALGPFVVPSVNGELLQSQSNVNMVTCGGQATVPIVAAISRVVSVPYAEIVATVSSRSAGPGTRANIDEFTETTALAIEKVGGAQLGKAIIILNPADPPILMRDTIHAIMADGSPETREKVTRSVQEMVREVQQYVPGYRLKNELLFEDNRVSVFIEVEGLGDFLPKYAGNLDIMTSAALRAGEELAKNRFGLLSGSQAQ